VIFVEHRPAPPLDRFIRVLWYAAAPQLDHAHERILPTGCVQVILNLERDFLHDCPEGKAERRMPPSLIVGARSIYEIVNTADMGELIGIVFEPGGFGPFAGDAVDLFSNRSVFLEDVCRGAGAWASRSIARKCFGAGEVQVPGRVFAGEVCRRPYSAWSFATRNGRVCAEHTETSACYCDGARIGAEHGME
jgi:hypothetical protein